MRGTTRRARQLHSRREQSAPVQAATRALSEYSCSRRVKQAQLSLGDCWHCPWPLHAFGQNAVAETSMVAAMARANFMLSLYVAWSNGFGIFWNWFSSKPICTFCRAGAHFHPMVDADTHQKLQSEYDKLNEQMTSLVTDFTTMNTQLMEHKGANYDLEKQGGMYKTQLKQLQEHVSRAETELRKSKGTSLRRRRGWSDVCWWCCCVWCVAREAARGGGRREDGVKGSESLWCVSCKPGLFSGSFP